MNRRLCIIIALCALLPAKGNAQDPYEEFKKQALEEYSQFSDQVRKEYASFRDQANAEYARFMQEPWPKADLNSPEPVPDRPEPVDPPVKTDPDKKRRPEEIPYDEVIPLPDRTPAPQPVEPIVPPPAPVVSTFDFDFYHTKCTVSLSPEQKFTLSQIDEQSVSEAWTMLSQNSYNNLIIDCLRLRDELNLCDWAYVILLQRLTESYFGSAWSSEAALMQMYILTQSGYKVRIARAGTRLVLLVPSDYTIYQYRYVYLGGTKFYVLNTSVKENLYVYDQVFPKEQIFSISMKHAPQLTLEVTPDRVLTSRKYPSVTVRLRTNKNLIDFYNDYPLSSNWDAYSRSSLSDEVKDRLYPVLKSAIAGKSEEEAANILINFVQTAFEYKTDDEQFGYERPLFGDETIYYPYSDCEDRAILYSILVRELLGRSVVLLYYPGHLATAVQFSTDIQGDYLMVNGTKYVICDPTYIGAPIGEAMPSYKNTKCTVIYI